jgi:hypothetical protein
MSADATATVRRWAALSLHAADVFAEAVVAVAASWLPPLLQPAANTASTATTQAAGRNRDIAPSLAENRLTFLVGKLH